MGCWEIYEFSFKKDSFQVIFDIQYIISVIFRNISSFGNDFINCQHL